MARILAMDGGSASALEVDGGMGGRMARSGGSRGGREVSWRRERARGWPLNRRATVHRELVPRRAHCRRHWSWELVAVCLGCSWIRSRASGEKREREGGPGAPRV